MSLSRMFGCRISAALAILSLASGSAQAANSADAIYTQHFDSAPSENQPLSSNDTANNRVYKWFAYGGSSCTEQSNEKDGCAVCSVVGSGNATGLAFTKPWRYMGYMDRQTLVGTSNFGAIDQSKYSSLTFSWDQWGSNTTMKSQLAVKIDGSWYVSKDAFLTAKVYEHNLMSNSLTNGESKFLALSAAAGWYALTATPGKAMSVGTTLVSLPKTGKIVAVGLYCTDTLTSTGDALCFDNFQINGVSASVP